MWYAFRCRAGQEKTLIRACERQISREVLETAFQFAGRRMKKYLGGWHTDTIPLFPGYVFLQSEAPRQLLEALKPFDGLADILEQDRLLLPVKPEQERLLRELCGDGHVLDLSRGRVKEGMFQAEEGPLVGREGLIRRLDLHRRIAVLDCRLPGETHDIWAGIDFKTDRAAG